MPDNNELLLVFDELGDIFAEEAEGGIGDDNIRLLQQLDALGATEISVTVQSVDSDLFWTRHPVAVPVAKIFKPDGGLAVVAAEKIHILILIAGGD